MDALVIVPYLYAFTMIPSENLFAFDLVLFKIFCHYKINLAGIIIQTSAKTDDGRRVYNKKHFCFYCSKPQAKISRHLMTSHKNEAEILALEEMKGKARDAHLDKLRNLGNHIHNVEVLKEKKGLFIQTSLWDRGRMKRSKNHRQKIMLRALYAMYI